MKVLGIESTCDETAASVVVDGIEILSNVIASQGEIHEKYGGVFPEMAARQHVELIIPTIDQALKGAGCDRKEIDLIAVASRPGLIGPLLIGLNTAKALHMAWDIPYIGVDHVEAHLYGSMMANESFVFPSIGLVVSGGHTFLVRMDGVGAYELLGTTVDDAVGEAFDKVATLLDLPYPGGPHVERLAKEGDPLRYLFKSGKVKGRPWDFSYSGLKTNVLYVVKGQNGDKRGKAVISDGDRADVAASFQRAALDDIVGKTLKAAEHYGLNTIYVGGGVSNNQLLQQRFEENRSEVKVYWPTRTLSLDNAAMIAGLGFHTYRGVSDPLSLAPITRSWVKESLRNKKVTV